ncbi:MAG: hypothetical protein A3J24_00295 [Deltaproteobacteria bacterium RIFCSPLOWO2_02_FULL_53_8]|nr:MAG: hypothetical protein A3J24_00295 [Deltaproteobacteria bacterium RIFCSPLOWO2_02_FULL_53_8]
MAGVVYLCYKKAARPLTAGKALFCFFCALLLAGCAPVISQPSLDMVDRQIGFKRLQADPVSYAGAKVLFGGAIISVENRSDATYVEVMQQPLGSRLKPVKSGESEGRFFVVFDGFKDPAVYLPNRLLTVVGKVKGAQARPLGMMQYNYPLIEPVEHYLWPSHQESTGPGFSIGLGFGVIDSR